MSDIADRIDRVRETMALAAQRCGRKTADIDLCAVTKYVPTDRILEAIRSGITIVGENRAQEFSEKLTFFKQHSLQAHFIGQLQTNKVKYICKNADLIQSVDRESLLETVDKRAAGLGVVQPVLIQVNIGEEAQKGGILPDQLPRLLDAAACASNVLVRGLMCVPPACPDESVRPYFRRMYELFSSYRSSYQSFDILSMGMSHDYHVAIEEGATMIRVGSAIFGPRQIQGGL